jgi:hypothetical protein
MAIDTLAIAKRMTQAGFTREQPEAQAEVMAEAFSTEVATNRDLADAVRELNAKIDAKIAALDAKIDTKFTALDAKIDTKIAELRAEMLRYMIGQTFAIGAIMFALLRFVR